MIVGDRVIAVNAAGELLAAALEDGAVTWSFDVGAGVLGTPAIGRGTLVVGTDDGRLFAFGDGGGR